RDLFVPKLCWSDRRRRLLRFDEFYRPEVRRLSYSNEHLHWHGLRILDNTAEEIRDVVCEMLDDLSGAAREWDDDRALRERFRKVAGRHGLGGFSRIGREFLRKYCDLLAPAAAEDEAQSRREVPRSHDALADVA